MSVKCRTRSANSEHTHTTTSGLKHTPESIAPTICGSTPRWRRRSATGLFTRPCALLPPLLSPSERNHAVSDSDQIEFLRYSSRSSPCFVLRDASAAPERPLFGLIKLVGRGIKTCRESIPLFCQKTRGPENENIALYCVFGG